MQAASWPATQWSRFVRWLLAGTIVLLAAVFALNALVDPRGIYGTGIWKPLIVEAGARRAKADLLSERARAPEWLILGSSTARNANPEVVARLLALPPHSVFNAGVSAGKPIDSYVLADLAERRPGAMPNLLWLVDVDGTFADTPVDSGIMTTGSLRASLSVPQRLELLPTVVKPYVEWASLKLTLRSLKADPLGRWGGHGHAARTIAENFTVDGFRRHDPYAGDSAERRERRRVSEGAAYRDRLYPDAASGTAGAAGAAQLGSQSRQWAERLLALASAHDVEPLVVLLPPHPQYRTSVERRGWVARRDAVRAWFAEQARTHPLRVVDMSDDDAAGREGRGFEDHVHLDEASMTRLLTQVLA